MPVYEYTCRDCGKKFEELVSSTRPEPIACPQCQSPRAERLFSVFGIAGAVKFSASTGSNGCASCTHSSCAGCADSSS